MNEKHLISMVKIMLVDSTDKSLIFLKERVSEDILSLELGFLYHKKVYGPKVNAINNIFSELSKEMDEILNHNNLALKQSMDKLSKKAIIACIREAE